MIFSDNYLSPLSQSAVQDVDYENELDLLYAVVTLPAQHDSSSEAWLCFVDERNGNILRRIALPTWKTVSVSIRYSPIE